MPKRAVELFVSWAHADAHRAGGRLADRLVARLQTLFAPSRRYDYRLWRDTEGGIALGTSWFTEIEAALDTCSGGLVLLSPALLQSPFIRDHELPHFVGGAAKPVLPVLLHPVDFARHDLRGLEAHQIFRLENRAYSQLTSNAQRERFETTLFLAIETRLDRLFGGAR
jgi:hypothetical protein